MVFRNSTIERIQYGAFVIKIDEVPATITLFHDNYISSPHVIEYLKLFHRPFPLSM